MVTLVALGNLKLTFQDRVQLVECGQVFSLPEEQALRLVEKVPGKVKIVQSGYVATWQSPVFGQVSGRILEVKAEMIVLTDHSVLKKNVTIPAEWVAGIEAGGKDF